MAQKDVQEAQTTLEIERSNLNRTKERLSQTQESNAATMRTIGNLEDRKAALQASINRVNREIDLQQVQLQDDCVVAEMCIKENIMRLTEHAETIKAQNKQLCAEMDEMVRVDEYAREQLRRNETIMRLKERNSAEMARSVRLVEQSRSQEAQQAIASKAAGLCIYCRQYDGYCDFCTSDKR